MKTLSDNLQSVCRANRDCIGRQIAPNTLEYADFQSAVFRIQRHPRASAGTT